MKFKQPTALLFVVATLLSAPAPAIEEIGFTPRISLARSSYQFSQTARTGALAPTGINGNDFPKVKFDVNFLLYGLGGTVFSGSYYLDLLYQTSSEESDKFSLDDPALPDGNFTETFSGDRQDLTLTFGKKVLQNRASLFVGYKSGKSEADGNQGQHLTFEEDGFFAGANYGFKTSATSVLSLNGAFALLDGNLKEKVTNPAFDSLNAPLDINATSAATGLSYGIGWSNRFSKKFSLSLALESRNYTFEKIKDKNPQTISSRRFEESFLNTTVSLFYLF